MKTGNTTRLVDRYIQELFNKRKTFIYEARNTESEYKKTEHCFSVFKNRMILEHESISWKQEYIFVDGIWCYKVELT